MRAVTLEDIVKRFRKPGKRSPKESISKWTESEVLDHEAVDCFVIVLRTRGCYWSRTSGCSMCGYINDCAEEASPTEINTQFDEAMESHAGQRYLKIYTSGSFLDEKEIDKNTALRIIDIALSQADRVLIESRPEFISSRRLERFPSKERIEVAIGLESANDIVLQKSINKNLAFEDFRSACGVCADLGIKTRAYVLIKPPFLTEKEAILDAKSSSHSCASLVNTVSLNPVNVQRNTLVEYLWRRGEYRSPWLWSVLEVVEASRDIGPRILVSVAGAGSRRGAHNCGRCDSAIIDFLKDFSLNGKLTSPALECECRDEWLDILDAQGPMQCSADPARFFDR
jgi:radical SAM enzyme (TIGR01210 family)